MSYPGSLKSYIQTNGYIIYVWNPVMASNLFQVSFRQSSRVIMSIQADLEKVEKIMKGEFDIESYYCPLMERDEFKIVYY